MKIDFDTKRKVIKAVIDGYSYSETADIYKTTRSAVAGILWRYKNPGMYTKDIISKSRNAPAS